MLRGVAKTKEEVRGNDERADEPRHEEVELDKKDQFVLEVTELFSCSR